jgi:DNA-binding MarR family transcriptional regulator
MEPIYRIVNYPASMPTGSPGSHDPPGGLPESPARATVPEPPPATTLDPIGRQLNVAARAARGLLDAVLAENGTTFSSWVVLAALEASGPTIQRDLATRLEMIGASVVERIDQLEGARLVERSSVPGDRRASLVSLTQRGRALFARVQGVMQATEAALLSGLEPGDVDATRRVLTQIASRARDLRAERSS